MLTVLYDAECVLCRRSKERVGRWKRASELRFVALQDPEARTLLPGLPEERFRGAMHVVSEGRVESGADGWFRIMAFAPLRLRWLAWITPRWLARPIYGWIARNRHRWFGKAESCDGGPCALHAPAATSASRSETPPNDSRDPSSPEP
jgi:predicted DCC family thiol-disulfide oxidoreductase YuxK